MKYQESEEQSLLRGTVRDLLGSRASGVVRRPGGDPRGYEENSWRELIDLGATGMLVPVAFGGMGLSMSDVGVVLEETGRACYSGPFLASAVLSVLVLAHADQDVQADLRALASGGCRGAVTALHGGPVPERWPVEAVASRDGAAWRLDGRARGVIHGWPADLLLVVAEYGDGIGVWAVDAGGSGHERTTAVTLDLTRGQSDHRFRSTPARLILSPSRRAESLRRVACLASIAVSAEQVGAARRLLDMSVEHARSRYQFGRPIGSFQAIKHTCVDMAIAVEAAEAASLNARQVADNAPTPMNAADTARLGLAAAIAGAHCSEALLAVAGATLQIHGGIGMAWEHDCHLYLRRAKAIERMFGTPGEHRRLIVSLLDAAPPEHRAG